MNENKTYEIQFTLFIHVKVCLFFYSELRGQVCDRIFK